MFSNKKLVLAIAGVIFFLTIVAFIEARPDHRNERVYSIVKNYMPFKIEKSLGGLKILRRDDPNFKDSPNAINFYHRLQYLEREWAKKHLKLNRDKLEILNNSGEIVKQISLKNRDEIEFVNNYFGIKQ